MNKMICDEIRGSEMKWDEIDNEREWNAICNKMECNF